jgi:hypothetical protein
MRIPLSALLISTLLLSACGGFRDSRVNPMNWFGNSRSEPVNNGTVNALIPQRRGGMLRREALPYQGTAVDTITELQVERAAGGAIVRVTGVARTLGSYEVFLTSDTENKPVDGVLTFTLKALVPKGAPAQGSAIAREISAAKFVTDRQLDGVRTIRVLAASNARSVRR